MDKRCLCQTCSARVSLLDDATLDSDNHSLLLYGVSGIILGSGHGLLCLHINSALVRIWQLCKARLETCYKVEGPKHICQQLDTKFRFALKILEC